MIYFKLQNDSATLPTQNYFGAAVNIDPNTIYVGQILLNSGSNLPLGGSTGVYGFSNTAQSNTTVVGQSFALSNFVIKVVPGSLNAYNFQTSKTNFELQFSV